MSLFSKLFGAKKAPVPRPAATGLSREELFAQAADGSIDDLELVLEGKNDDDAFELLLELLPASRQHARVDVIDHVAEFELSLSQQRALLDAAVTDVPGPMWTAASALAALDVAGLLAVSAEDGVDESVVTDSFARLGTLLSALAEATVTTGPAGTFVDVPGGGAKLQAWAEKLPDQGAKPADLVTLAMVRQLCEQAETDDELLEAGFGEELFDAIEGLTSALLDKGAADGQWTDVLPGMVRSAPLAEALVGLQAAAVADVPVRAALSERVKDNPADEPTWDLAVAAGLDASMLGVLAPVGAATLQMRRLGEDEFCSPASQVGCLKCGGGKAAADDELMVPRALRDRLLPVLASMHVVPGQHPDFLMECLAAPDPSLRYHALVAFGHWQPESVPDAVRQMVQELASDSMPVVQNQALELQRALA